MLQSTGKISIKLICVYSLTISTDHKSLPYQMEQISSSSFFSIPWTTTEMLCRCLTLTG